MRVTHGQTTSDQRRYTKDSVDLEDSGDSLAGLTLRMRARYNGSSRNAMSGSSRLAAGLASRGESETPVPGAPAELVREQPNPKDANKRTGEPANRF